MRKLSFLVAAVLCLAVVSINLEPNQRCVISEDNSQMHKVVECLGCHFTTTSAAFTGGTEIRGDLAQPTTLPLADDNLKVLYDTDDNPYQLFSEQVPKHVFHVTAYRAIIRDRNSREATEIGRVWGDKAVQHYAKVKKADELTIVEKQGQWFKVRFAPKKTGWIHQSVGFRKQSGTVASEYPQYVRLQEAEETGSNRTGIWIIAVVCLVGLVVLIVRSRRK